VTLQSINREVVVVGARAAGSATAMLLAQQGHDVVVVDRAQFPSDTLSTHALSRGGVVQLSRWGLLGEVLDSGAPPIRQASFHARGERIVKAVKDRAGVDLMIAPRRHILDTLLADAAMGAGAEYRFGSTVTDLRFDGGRVTGIAGRDEGGAPFEIDARFVIGADGVRSRVARAAGAELTEVRSPGAATFYAYFAGLDWDGFEFHLGDDGFAGVFPTHGGEANVWISSPVDRVNDLRADDFTPAQILDMEIERVAPELARRLAGAERTSRMHSAVGLPNHLYRPVGPGWALVGDAGYHRDPITGHGITDAFRDAELLAAAVGQALRGEVDEYEALDGYHRRRDEMLRDIFELTVALSQHPPVDQFTELQRTLSQAIEAEAEALAGLPPLFTPAHAVAA
jgi:flavin-dependent dehydrogenase